MNFLPEPVVPAPRIDKLKDLRAARVSTAAMNLLGRGDRPAGGPGVEPREDRAGGCNEDSLGARGADIDPEIRRASSPARQLFGEIDLDGGAVARRTAV